MGFIIAAAVIRSDANLCFQKELSLLSVYLIVKGKVKLMNSTKGSLQGLRRPKLFNSVELHL